jgi:hypothetical protein
MSAAEALQAALAAGIQVEIDGADLLLKASAPPPAVVLDGLSRHKARILALLRPAKVDRAADEFDGGLSRAQANAHAFEYCVIEWLNRNPAQSVPGHCLDCGAGNRRGDPLLPFGMEMSVAAWDVLAGMASVAARQGHCSAASNTIQASGLCDERE